MPPESAVDPASMRVPEAPETIWATRLSRLLLRNRTLLERLGELRSRTFKALGALALGALVAWLFYSPILSVLTQPLKSLPGAPGLLNRGKLVFTAPTEAFYVRIRVTMFAGAALASPFILWQAWRFFVGGLRLRGTRSAVVVVAASIVLFLIGGAFAFGFVSPALRLFLYLGGPRIVLLPRAADYLSFVMLLVIAFGLTFEYPLLLLALMVAGVITSTQLRKKRRIAYFALLVVAAVVTPTVDPITPLFLALPLGVLYEATILTARVLKR